MNLDKDKFQSLEEVFPLDSWDALRTTSRGTFPVSQLQRFLSEAHTGGPAEEYWAVAFASEYCMADCDGEAHRTGVSDAREGCFCGNHVQRDVHVEVRKFPDMVPALQQM